MQPSLVTGSHHTIQNVPNCEGNLSKYQAILDMGEQLVYSIKIRHRQQRIKQTTAGTAGSNACEEYKVFNETRKSHPIYWVVVHRLL